MGLVGFGLTLVGCECFSRSVGRFSACIQDLQEVDECGDGAGALTPFGILTILIAKFGFVSSCVCGL